MAHSADFQGTPALRMGKFWNYIEDVEHDTLWNIYMVENDFFIVILYFIDVQMQHEWENIKLLWTFISIS